MKKVVIDEMPSFFWFISLKKFNLTDNSAEHPTCKLCQTILINFLTNKSNFNDFLFNQHHFVKQYQLLNNSFYEYVVGLI